VGNEEGEERERKEDEGGVYVYDYMSLTISCFLSRRGGKAGSKMDWVTGYDLTTRQEMGCSIILGFGVFLSSEGEFAVCLHLGKG